MKRAKGIRPPAHNNTSLLLAGVLLSCTFFCQVPANSKTRHLQNAPRLQIYLPREVAIKDGTIKLGQISIIRGEDSLAAKAGEIALGRIWVPGQKITVDRPTVLSRLACSRIPASGVILTGAQQVTVKRQGQIIKGSDFVELARAFLKKHLPDDSICQMTPVRVPRDFILPKQNDVILSPCLAQDNSSCLARVKIMVLVAGRRTDLREVTFRLKYNCRRAVALVDIPAGAVISPQNVKIENVASSYPEPADWKAPYGLVAKRRLPANTQIRPQMASPIKPPVIVKRNQNVLIRVQRPGLLVTAIGKTMQDGRAGEFIKVRNTDSARIILARVNNDGTVEPVF